MYFGCIDCEVKRYASKIDLRRDGDFFLCGYSNKSIQFERGEKSHFVSLIRLQDMCSCPHKRAFKITYNEKTPVYSMYVAEVLSGMEDYPVYTNAIYTHNKHQQ